MQTRVDRWAEVRDEFAEIMGALPAGTGFQGVISLTSLNGQPFTRVQPDFQLVKSAVELWRRESEDVNIFGLIGGASEAFVQIVVVVEEGASGAIGELGEDVALAGIPLPVVPELDDRVGRVLLIRGGHGSDEAADVERIDDDFGAQGGLGEVADRLANLGGERQESGGNENDAAAPGSAGSSLEDVMQHVHHRLILGARGARDFDGGRSGDLLGTHQIGARCRPAKGAVESVTRGKA